MSDNSRIEWTDATWNPISGCSRVSEGCRNCYAERLSHRFGWTDKPWSAAHASVNVKLHPERLEQPLKWRKPRKVFVNSMSDLFHEEVSFDFIDQVFAVMALCTEHTFQVLTKRPERMLEYMTKQGLPWNTKLSDISSYMEEWGWISPEDAANIAPGSTLFEWPKWPLPNVWLGVSIENQKTADKRIPLLLRTPATIRFLSCEPLLGPLNLREIDLGSNGYGLSFKVDALTGWSHGYNEKTGRHKISRNDEFDRIDWVIVGGESGPNARPMHPDWVRDIRDQCQEAGVPFFFKQFGEWAPVHELQCNEPGIKGKPWYNFDPDTAVCRVGKKKAGRQLDGRTWDEFPEVRTSI